MPVGPDNASGATSFLISHSFDREAIIGDYAGLAAFWVLGTNEGFPSEFAFNTSNNWITDMRGGLNDGLSGWVAYRVWLRPNKGANSVIGLAHKRVSLHKGTKIFIGFTGCRAFKR